MLIKRSLSPVEVVFCLYPQVFSAYNEPARMELNYHAGISVHRLVQLVIAYHTSVQCFNTDYADIITAVLLIVVCMDEHLDLANIDLDNEAATKMPHKFPFFERSQ